MPQASPDVPASFETALQELETIVRALEDGGTPLEESLKAYERGMALLKQCQETLGRAEQKIRILDQGEVQDFAGATDNEKGAG
jgi:exodeoxyribonuclease VII small subunit